jgi:predicted RecA/RadA family phage recombinase
VPLVKWRHTKYKAMNTQINRGKEVEVVTPAGGYISGQPVLVGSLVGIAANTYAAGDTAVIWLVGSHTVAKAAEVWTAGAKLYWDDTNKVFTVTATNNTFAGYAYAAATNGAATGIILLRQ